MVDASRVRDTLDRLNGALARPFAPLGSPAVVHDRAAVLIAVGEVLNAIDAIDVDARRATAGLVATARTTEHLRHLGHVLGDLTDAWAARVRGSLDPDARRIAASLVRDPAPDMLAMLGKSDDENAHSDVLRWLLDPACAPTIAPSALRGLCARLDNSGAWRSAIDRALAAELVSVRREYVFGREWIDSGDLARIDLVVMGPGFVVAIEAKLWSSEHSEQTATYAGWLDTIRGLTAGVFLSPAGTPAQSTRFKALSYLDLASILLGAVVESEPTPAERIVLAGFMKSLARGPLRAELRTVLAMEGKT
jgi:hypothetical protein